jgi:hypothetical protein
VAWQPEPTYQKKTRWYGWQTLLGLAGTDLLMMAGGGYVGSAPIIITGLFSRPLVPPIVHWSHGHVGKGFGSLGLNVGGPLLAGLIGAGIAEASSDGSCGIFGCGFGGFVVGFVLGGFVSPIIDIAALSTEEVEVPVTRAGFAPQSLTLVPIAGPTHGGLGLAGQF